MTARAATPADAEAIAAIWNHAIRNTTITFNPVEKSVEEVAELCRTRAFVWEEDGAVLGFARYFAFRGGEGYRHTAEHTIMLRDGISGRGIGRTLMQTLCDDAAKNGIHSLFAGCSAENPGAVRFHERVGFATVATLPQVGFKFGRWIDLVLMQKFL